MNKTDFIKKKYSSSKKLETKTIFQHKIELLIEAKTQEFESKETKQKKK